MKKVFMFFMALSFVFSFTACGKGNEETASKPDNNEPVVTQVPKSNKELYAQILGNYFTALNLKWDKDILYEQGISTLTADFYEGNPFENIGYAFLDLNEDGEDELLIAVVKKDSPDKDVILDLYTLEGKYPTLINKSNSDYYYKLCLSENNEYIIVNEQGEEVEGYESPTKPEYVSFKDGSILE